MIDEQQAIDLAVSTPMTHREARTFLQCLADWQRRDSLTDVQVAECKQAAIDAAYVVGIYRPLDVLLAMYALTKEWR